VYTYGDEDGFEEEEDGAGLDVLATKRRGL
jgi:hypothetical protein